MKDHATNAIRNIALVGHGAAGKTTLMEAMLFDAKAITRMGSIENGTTVSDFEPEEIKKQFSISAAIAPCEHGDVKINIIDTPGYADFIGEVIGSLRAVDNACFVIEAVHGQGVQTEHVAELVKKEGLPSLVAINGMDRENADFFARLEEIKRSLFKDATPLSLPIGSQAEFKGVVDLIKMKAIMKDGSESEIPDDMKGQADEYHEKMVELTVEVDDKLLETYLEEGEVDEAQLRQTLRQSIGMGHLVPVVATSASANIGVATLLDVISTAMASPEDRPAVMGINPKTKDEVSLEASMSGPLAVLVFKTVSDPYVGKLDFARVFSGVLKADSQIYNSTRSKKEKVGHILQVKGKTQEDIKSVVAGDIAALPKLEGTFTGDTLCEESKPVTLPAIDFPQPVFPMAIFPKTRGEEDKLATALHKMLDEDPTFKISRDASTGQSLASALGDMQLEIIVDKLKRKFGVEAKLELPRVPYKETIASASKAQGKYKKQTGGHGQYGDVWLEVEPLPHGSGFEFVDKIFGGSIPKNYVPAVEKGVKEAMAQGIVAGYPVVDIKVTVYDGSFHPVDSSDMSFKIAAAMAFRKCMETAQPALLEPIADLEVVVPEGYTGDVIGDLNAKRGRILGMEPSDKKQVVRATVPLAEMRRYASELRSITHGQGVYHLAVSNYEQVPPNVTEKVVKEAQAEKND
ncbi:MAG: elongation factor G [Actinomycetota bacterium]